MPPTTVSEILEEAIWRLQNPALNRNSDRTIRDSVMRQMHDWLEQLGDLAGGSATHSAATTATILAIVRQAVEDGAEAEILAKLR